MLSDNISIFSSIFVLSKVKCYQMCVRVCNYVFLPVKFFQMTHQFHCSYVTLQVMKLRIR